MNAVPGMTLSQQRTALLIAQSIERYHSVTVQRVTFAPIGEGHYLITRATLYPRNAA